MVMRATYGASVALVLTVFAAGCRSSGSSAKALNEAAQPSPAEAWAKTASAEARRFRSLFRQIGAAQGLSDSDMQKMVLVPSQTFLTAPAEATAATTAAAANAAVVAQAEVPTETAGAFYQNSLATPFDLDVDPEAIFAKHGPATLIFIPGIFGEFIDKSVIHELYQTPTSFSRAYQDQLKQVQDQGFSLAALGNVSFNLDERVQLGGIDGADQKPKIQAMFIRAAFGSMESLGNNGANAEIFLRRINKAFSKIPLDSCKNIYLVGYSQGTGVVLDMLAKAAASPAQYPFFKNLKGVMTLSGVIYGTEVADDAFFNANSTSYKMTQQIKATLDGLQVPAQGDDFLSANGKLMKDWGDIIQAAGSLAQMPKPTPDPGLAKESLTSAVADPAQQVELVGHIFSDLFHAGLSPEERLANIQRGKMVLSAVMEGTKGLATQSRIAWWASHQLPVTVPVYSVATTLPERTTDLGPSLLLPSPYYGSDTYDYQSVLRPGYYSMYGVVPAPLNDSQVLTQKMMILPTLIPKWNPQQPPFPVHFIGVLGTHHWGVAFPNASDTAGGASNPFPRRVFAEALGAFLLEPSAG